MKPAYLAIIGGVLFAGGLFVAALSGVGLILIVISVIWGFKKGWNRA